MLVVMNETPHPWDRLENEPVKAFNGFRTYCSLGPIGACLRPSRSVLG